MKVVIIFDEPSNRLAMVVGPFYELSEINDWAKKMAVPPLLTYLLHTKTEQKDNFWLSGI